MRTKTLILAIGLLSIGLSGQAMAQFDFGGGGETSSKPAWEEFKLNPKTRVKLDFRGANIDMVLSFFQRSSGVTIVKDPALVGPFTITSAGQVSLNDAFAILNATLSLKNYDLKKEGKLMVIRQKQARPAQPAFDPSMFMNMGNQQQSQSQLKVYPIAFANASQVARVVNEVFAAQTDLQNQLNPFAGFGGGGNPFAGGNRFGGGGGGGPQFGRGGGQGGNPFGGGRFGGFGRGGGATSSVRASSDEFSNSVIINAPEREQKQVSDLIKQIDKQNEQPQQPKVFKLTYATATELAPVVQNVLTSNAPRGRGGIGTQNVPIEQRFQQAFRFGNAQAAFGTVVAETRTNSLIVTATDENLKMVDEVIAELDKEVQFESSTFVFPLANARADQVANLMQQAFGTRQGLNRGGGGNQNFNRNQNQNRNNNRNNAFGGGGGGGGGLGGRAQPNTTDNTLAVPLADPNSEGGELMTMVDVDQGFGQGGGFGGGGGGGFFGGGRQNQATTTQGRNAQGQLVNVRDLTGQVTTIADPNTNSIIVVTTPENAELIRKVLSDLDKIPEQVMIETIIVEATLDSSSKLGVEWRISQPKAFGTTSTGTVQSDFKLQAANNDGFKYTISGGNLTAFINALQTDQKFQVLSTPRIFTSNNVEAQINISQSVPYVLSTREDTNGNLTFNYAFQDVGIVLTVTPRITSNGYVTMDVSQTANDLQGFTSFNAPIVNQRQADTTVSVKDGDTIILGGIMRTTVSSTVKKVPILGQIPILGELFKSTDRSKQKTELLVFLTPRVVRNPDEAKKLREEETKKLSAPTQKNIDTAIPPKKEEKGTGNGGN